MLCVGCSCSESKKMVTQTPLLLLTLHDVAIWNCHSFALIPELHVQPTKIKDTNLRQFLSFKRIKKLKNIYENMQKKCFIVYAYYFENKVFIRATVLNVLVCKSTSPSEHKYKLCKFEVRCN